MIKLSLLLSHRNIKVFNWICGILILAYFVSMFIWPVINTGGDWQLIQNVWDRWQPLNVGMLAFVSSLIAFNISRYNAEQKRAREFRANRSFLPEAFSELTIYCKKSTDVFTAAWKKLKDEKDTCDTPLEGRCPCLPKSYREVFKECISVAEPEVGERLSRILSLLQIHHAGLTGLFDDSENNTLVIRPANIIDYFYGILKIQALIYKMFDFARGSKEFDGSDPVRGDYWNVFNANNIPIDVFDELWGLIEKEIERRHNSDESA